MSASTFLAIPYPLSERAVAQVARGAREPRQPAKERLQRIVLRVHLLLLKLELLELETNVGRGLHVAAVESRKQGSRARLCLLLELLLPVEQVVDEPGPRPRLRACECPLAGRHGRAVRET